MTEANKPHVNEKRRNLLKLGGLSLAGIFTGAVGSRLFGKEASTSDAAQATITNAPASAETSPTSTNTVEPTGTPTQAPTETPQPTATPTPEATATDTPQPTATETEVPKNVVLFDGDPRSATTKEAIGDKGFQSECNFGDQVCPAWGRIVWGPFVREADQADRGIKDGVKIRITYWGNGDVKVGATDSRYFNGDMFGYGGIQANLSRGPVTFEFTSQILGNDINNLAGYGWETIVQQMPTQIDENGNEIPNTLAEKGKVSRIKIEVIG